ncbi:uncharacterized protein UV8b_00165 [Ustilaginoidea virens]|uniref:Conserved oligomeric Golgi complex subunit 8 n=1 Tax=Ustilaginoidea virens TaxID=1159556 RepID=A0A1B5L8A8_USTVR|nr:uncharacterized protein UV8b_00165 [Ustilaginoidea virens]QUC15924.1 hypothetical protein UV8b_00165 [Ustilaginoidea virens]GAO19918.1 hypothetical protein UVI_02039150 [Ustilaginoidea virens]
MTEALNEQLLGPDLASDVTAVAYLEYLAGQPVDSLRNFEPQNLSHALYLLLRSVQSLSKKSYEFIVDSATDHTSLEQLLPILRTRSNDLMHLVPRIDQEAERFSNGFSKVSDNIINKRKQALRQLHNSGRLVDLMGLPALLKSAIKSNAAANYSSALDIYAHAHRLASLYPTSSLVISVTNEATTALKQMAEDLMASLKTTNLKLASGLRTVGWLKRIIPVLVSETSMEQALPAIFLVCRLNALILTLDALHPLKELADKEGVRHTTYVSQMWSGGQHTERYLKRFIEVFREHSFSLVSVSKSVDASFANSSGLKDNVLYPFPPILACFPLHMVGLLLDTLQLYLPNIKDKTSRESIFTQLLYCAGSLGRLGVDFGMLLSVIGMNEWIGIVKRHRLLAGRLESVIGDYRGNQSF